MGRRAWILALALSIIAIVLFRGAARSAAPFTIQPLNEISFFLLYLPKARAFQNAAHAVGISEREWTGRIGIVHGLRRQMIGRGAKRQDVELVLLERAPANHRQH